ncbi:MAG: carboxypeptidase M32 [Gemmataceae bacterium]|nr:carboxypeptidase M32 [Gemmataceae bacterium]
MPSADSAYGELLDRARESATLGSCAAVLGWDERTFLPPGGSGLRGRQMALLARMCHEMATHPRVGELLQILEDSELNGTHAANLREWRRGYDRAVKLPSELVSELASVTSEAQSVWQEAKHKSDFALFRPWLEKIVLLKRREAECVGYVEDAYDALVDEFEPGATALELTRMLGGLSRDLAPLVAEIVAKQPSADESLWTQQYPLDVQEQICREVAKSVGFDFHRGRLDTTSHPFCTGIGPGDCRILTRYHVNKPFEAFFGTLHEAGHGLYEQGLLESEWATPCGMAASFGIHESQSRLWENQIGRSREFWSAWGPRFRSAFSAFRSTSDEEFWCLLNQVKPSLIRIDADEATYNLHIVLRFELELALMSGDVAAADLPGAWADKVRQYLGLPVPDDAHGCLQDIHWSFGGIGYFPSYTLGNLYAAQILEAAEKQIPALWDGVREGQLSVLTDWLRANIHVHGQRFQPAELIQRVTGTPPDPGAFLRYLRGKYLGVAG